jgi:hypothetical protein
MQSWIHVLEWRAPAHPVLTALADEVVGRFFTAIEAGDIEAVREALAAAD